ncbi:MAG TPA: hypothetical protein VGJ44_01740 [Kribbellaceae bacterium]|jgi:hypothetical protein
MSENVRVSKTKRVGTEVVDEAQLFEGPAAAAVLAAGIGATALGVATTAAEASTKVSGWLDLYSRVGPLSGKTIFAVAVWLVSWAVLHFAVKDRIGLSRRVLTITGVLIGLGVLGTFPTFFDLFAD